MLDPIFFTILLFAFAIGWVALAFHSARSVKTTTDYFLAGKNLGVLPIALTLMATQIGGGFLSGIAQESYVSGYYGILYALGISTGFILLGLGVAHRLKALDIATTAELFETKYKSKILRKIAATLLLASLWGILIAQIIAFKTVIAGLGISNNTIIIFFWLSIIFHTMLGGLKAVVNIDIFKQIFIVVIFFGLFIFYIVNDFSSFFSYQAQTSFSSNNASFNELIAVFLMPTLFCLIEQDLAQCFFAAQSTRVATKAAMYASAFLMLFSVAPVYFGMQTRLLNLPIEKGANPLILFLSTKTYDIIFLLAVMALIAAITSTANSLLCAISAHISQDIVNVQKEKHNLYLPKLITFFAGVSALIASFFVTENILGVLTTSYELSISCLFIPSLFAYFKPKVKTESAFGAIIFGAIGFILFRFIPLPIPKEIATLLASLIGYLIPMLIQK